MNPAASAPLQLLLGLLFATSALASDISQFETTKLGAGPVSLALSFAAPGKDWTGTLLSRRAQPGVPSLSVTAFRHEPFGKRYLGVAMDGPAQAAALTVRDSVVGGHLVCAFTEMDETLDRGTHDLVFRCDGKLAELFVAGVRREPGGESRDPRVADGIHLVH